MISAACSTSAQCPDCAARSRAATPSRACRQLRPRVRVGHAAISTCGRSTRSPNRRSTSTRRSTPTRGTSRSRRRCSDRRSATTCCGGSSARRRATASIDLGCGSGRALAWNAGLGRGARRHRHQPVLRAARRSSARDLVLGDLRAPAAPRRRVHQGVVARRARASVAARRSTTCCARPTACWPTTVRCSSTRTCARTAGSPAACGWSTGWRASASGSGCSICARSGCASRTTSTRSPITTTSRACVGECGLPIERITYYTPVVGAFVENILVRMAERLLARARRVDAADAGDGRRGGPRGARVRPGARPPAAG